MQADSLPTEPQGKLICIEYIYIYRERETERETERQREKTERKFTKIYLEIIFLARYSGFPGDTYFLYFSAFSECFIL